jgi:outer membrane lipoprotein carrier protein
MQTNLLALVRLMFNLRSAAFAAVVFCGASMSFVDSAKAGAIEQLREFAGSTKSAVGEFSQSQVKRAGRTEVTTGLFSFSRPGKFRWDIRKPYEQLLVADGEKAWFFDKDLNQVTVRKVGAALGATPAAILFGGTDLDKDFTLIELPAKQGLEWLEAIPKSRDAGFEKITMGFAAGVPTTLEIRDSFGQLVVVTLRNVVRNGAINAAAFQFTPPKGADVVEQ